MESNDFDIQAARENLRRREAQRFQERETRRLAAREAVLTAIRSALPSYPDVRRVYLYGSVTQAGRFRHDSDVDIAVQGTNAEQYWALWRDLDRATPDWMIDLREINEPSHFADRVREQGELVYERPDGGSES